MRIPILCGALLLAAAQVSAQDAELLRKFEQTLDEMRQSHFETTGNLSLTEHGRFQYGAYTTWSFLAVDSESGQRLVLRQWDTKLWTEVNAAGHTLYGRLRFRYQDFDSGDSFTGSGDGFTWPAGDRYWYRYDWRTDQRARTGTDPGWNWWAQAGRQYVHWVSGLVLSDTLYAARAGADLGRVRVDTLVGFTPDSFIDLDASRPGYTTDTDRLFLGIVTEYRGLKNHRPYVYFLRQEDDNGTTLPGGARWLYDSWYVAVGSTGQIVTGAWLYRVELVYEGGRSISDLAGVFPQTIDDIEAWAGRILVAWMPHRHRFTRGLRFELEVFLGSGDSDRAHSSQAIGGNAAGTKDESFNAFGYANTGLALAPDLANLAAVRIGASALPWRGRGAFDRLRLAVDAFVFAKMDGDAPVSVTTTTGQSFVGFEVDFVVNWLITSDLALDVQYGIFIPGDAVADKDVRHFFFLGFSYGF